MAGDGSGRWSTEARKGDAALPLQLISCLGVDRENASRSGRICFGSAAVPIMAVVMGGHLSVPKPIGAAWLGAADDERAAKRAR